MKVTWGSGGSGSGSFSGLLGDTLALTFATGRMPENPTVPTNSEASEGIDIRGN